MRLYKSHWLISAFLFCAALLTAFAPPQWHVAKTMRIGGTGAWDYLTVDPFRVTLFHARPSLTLGLYLA